MNDNLQNGNNEVDEALDASRVYTEEELEAIENYAIETGDHIEDYLDLVIEGIDHDLNESVLDSIEFVEVEIGGEIIEVDKTTALALGYIEDATSRADIEAALARARAIDYVDVRVGDTIITVDAATAELMGGTGSVFDGMKKGVEWIEDSIRTWIDDGVATNQLDINFGYGYLAERLQDLLEIPAQAFFKLLGEVLPIGE